METSDSFEKIIAQLNSDDLKLGDIKKIAKGIKKDHQLALQLWNHEGFHQRMLAVLIMDKKLIDDQFIDDLADDLKGMKVDERNYIGDWLLANQLMKNRKLSQLIEGWRDHSSPFLRRLFWYHQARLRWGGKTPPSNTAELLHLLKEYLPKEEPEVQWTINFCAGMIAIYEERYREEIVKLGEEVALYKGEKVSKGCTPSYLPEFVRIEVEKIKG